MNEKLSKVELDLEEVQVLPEREALGSFNWANVYASNTAVALNAASYWSVAKAAAVQTIVVKQH
ncbi:hypothetical protein FB561_7536 [Kribbella amoyensis]|uniref:Uncharacterized protein n=1 Tax=Kribbella amoyensis TaxID=996641 RepID=A0A561B110_9ACTN|nr:hypothetical protein [Kribbella amoyensis]TWD72544.1 hypothetical protein FB561_7536 [Kribbella amoyensis]